MTIVYLLKRWHQPRSNLETAVSQITTDIFRLLNSRPGCFLICSLSRASWYVSGVRIARSFVFYVVFWIALLVPLSILFLPFLSDLSLFDLRLLSTLLIANILFYYNYSIFNFICIKACVPIDLHTCNLYLNNNAYISDHIKHLNYLYHKHTWNA